MEVFVDRERAVALERLNAEADWTDADVVAFVVDARRVLLDYGESGGLDVGLAVTAEVGKHVPHSTRLVMHCVELADDWVSVLESRIDLRDLNTVVAPEEALSAAQAWLREVDDERFLFLSRDDTVPSHLGLLASRTMVEDFQSFRKH